MSAKRIAEVARLTRSYDLVGSRAVVGRLWECCGATRKPFTDSLPVGIEVFCSSTPVEDHYKVVYAQRPRYGITTKAVDVGLGNYLNIKMVHCIDRDEPGVDAYEGSRNVSVADVPVNEDGPPVYHGYFSGVNSALLHGWRTADHWDAPNVKDRGKFLSTLAGMKGFTSTWVIREAGVSQRKDFDKFVKDVGWDQHLVYESPLFNNRVHDSPVDSLRLVVFQIKED